MIPYIPCETARERLEAFVDGELPMADQVAVQAHLRACSTCAAHVEDLSLIGWSVRSGAAPVNASADETRELAAIQSGVLARIRAERAQSLRSRATELFADMRLLWPALGATTAVIIGFVVAVHVWSTTTALRGPDSLAGILHTMGPPGSDNNPMRINPGMSIPRVMDEGRAFDQVSSGDAEFAVAAILTQAGRVARTEVLDPPRVPTAPQADVVEAVLDAFRESRYEPAQGPGGRRLAVMAVFYFTNTTVRESPAGLDFSRPAVRPAAPPAAEPRVRVPATPAGTRSALIPRSATA